ncbi:hypothetical protein BH780_gp230 [Bacillus phage Eldridge]|uniref:Uncharacterized protein n=1 Tax=Bacillus phage Eldridge TaxID=1776293 RepID=A0A0Y0AID9_9CAUD|nr:hypothetical protein BH780_gp230 [Bacillus phage Eldridge]AMB18813.1 hypothetical protein Eldridge_0233 [Bacillus phage Eldridge]
MTREEQALQLIIDNVLATQSALDVLDDETKATLRRRLYDCACCIVEEQLDS